MALAMIWVALGLPAAAGATPTWTMASPVAESPEAEAVDVAMGAHGNVAVAWVSAGTKAEMVARLPGRSFSPIVDLSPAGSEFAKAAAVAEDGAGETVAVWDDSVEKSNLIIEAAIVTGGVRSTPSKLSAPGQNAVFPTVAVDERGDAVVAWMRSNGSHNVVQASFRPAGGSFSAPVNLSAESGNATAPKAAIDTAGEAIVVWEQNNGSSEVVDEATRPAAGTSFTAAVALSNPAEGASSQVSL